MKILCKFTKLGYLKFISHLDLVDLFQRTLFQNKVDVKFSEGFNPHPRMSIAYPLPLGIESNSEYMEIYLNSEVDLDDFVNKMNERLPIGIKIVEAKYDDDESISNKVKSVVYAFKLLNTFYDKNKDIDLAKELDKINAMDIVEIERKRKKGKKRIFVKENAKDYLNRLELKDNAIYAYIKMSEQGSLKPALVLDILNNYTDIVMDELDIDLERIGLYKDEEGTKEIFL
ncbi:MAG: TIGR03936 family radical SAM-associated protein [Eubacteriales bacterium]|uniref:TIGR03936 family radical SAM-associated protein n=1 Tax=Fenollaria sp. TaxID=1965292 RepID=UPI002A75511C|nr:TIGR03936 family radical SAM-associated protein [Fenollaria sp.]MDD7340160.1 TIGR03936 family radical SAM-associated protein [Eubacteriales bacterium]MDY3105584.1 TIGR03936 family radical SAM-associated protein [Fenollaria sp.]